MHYQLKKRSQIDYSDNENDPLKKKLKEIYNYIYEDNFFYILNISKISFLNRIDSKAKEITEVILNPKQQKNNANIINKIKLDINSRYIEDYSILYQTYKNIRNKSGHYNYLSKFRKHCEKTAEYAYHSCNKGNFKKFYEIKVTNKLTNKEEIKYVLCPDCKYCFLSDCIRMVCQECNKEYFSSVLPDNQDKNILLATWEKYHCGSMKNQIMKCIKCKKDLYINLYSNQLLCINKSCNFMSKPLSILWKCSKCGKDFRSKAKVYNPTELKIIQRSINLALLIKKKAYPKELPCCHRNPKELTFFHKDECKGVLYLGFLLDKEIVICEKCHAMNFEEKFTWICPICKVRFHLHQLISIKPFRARKYILNRDQSLLNKGINKSIINIKNLKNEMNTVQLKKENLLNDMYKSIQVNNDSVLSNRNINLNKNKTNTNDNYETEVQVFSDNSRSISNDKIFKKFDSISIEEDKFKFDKENNERNNEKICFGLKSELIHKSHKEKGRHYKTLLDLLEKRKKKDSVTKTDRHLTNNSEQSKDLNSIINYDRSSTGATNIEKAGVGTYQTSRNCAIKKNDNSRWNCISEAKDNSPNDEDDNYIYKKKITISSYKSGNQYDNNNYKNNKKEIDISEMNRYQEDRVVEPLVKSTKAKNSFLSSNSINIDNDSLGKKSIINYNGNRNYGFRINNSSANIIENRICQYNKRNSRRGHNIYISNNQHKDLEIKNIKNNDNINESDENKKIKVDYHIKYYNRRYKNENDSKEKSNFNSKEKEEIKINYITKYSLKSPSNKDENKSSDKPIKVSRLYHNRIFNKKNNTKNYNEEISDNNIIESKIDKNNENKDALQNKIQQVKIKKPKNENYSMNNIIATPDKINEIQKNCPIPDFKDSDFKYIRPIGEGSYGMIYLVENIKNNKEYALKKILCKSLKEIIKHKNQLELIYSLNHENIMKIYNLQFKYLDLTTYSLYVIMERAIGDWSLDIRKRILKKKFYKESEIINILKQVVGALSYMEENKIAHRDIKPQNILIFPGKIYKVGDLGEAKKEDNESKEKTLRGSELYMSPLIYQRHKLNKRDVIHNAFKSDVFSLGYSALYAICLNLNVLEDIRELDSMKKIANIVDKYFNRSLYSEKLYKLIFKMIEINENKRSSFKELEKELKNL